MIGAWPVVRRTGVPSGSGAALPVGTSVDGASAPGDDAATAVVGAIGPFDGCPLGDPPVAPEEQRREHHDEDHQNGDVRWWRRYAGYSHTAPRP